jgi:high-affinity iron transporter
MLASAIILFRESLEAALIISIVLTATRGLRHRGLWVNLGVLAGIAGAIAVALFAQQISDLAEGTGQELFNACILLAACLMLGWHNVWMARHGRELSARVNQVGRAVQGGERHMGALAIVVGLAVLREGSEVVLFLTGILAADTQTALVLAGAAAGLAAGALVGVLLYFGLMRIPVRHLFNATSALVLVLAAGLASQAAGYLVQAGYVPALQEPIWDTSKLLSESSIPGQLLHSLVGYSARPSGMQIIFWVVTFMLIWQLMSLTRKSQGHPRTVPAVAWFLVAGLGLLHSEQASASHKIYSPIVDFGETEIEFRGHYNFDDDNEVDGSGKYKLDFGRGFTPHWFAEVVLEYEQEASGGGVLEAVEWENVIQLTEQGEYAVDWGVLAEYSHALEDGHADKFEFGPLAQTEFGRLLWISNLILEVPLSGDDGVEWEFASRLQRRISPAFEPGLELYWSEDELQIGPALLGETRTGSGLTVFSWQAGILAGLTNDTPDLAVRFLVELEFY